MARFGMFLIRVVVWATDQLSRQNSTQANLLRATAAHTALALVRLVGTIVDALPVPDGRRQAAAAALRTSPLSARVRPC
jgi:hypothetical protein